MSSEKKEPQFEAEKSNGKFRARVTTPGTTETKYVYVDMDYAYQHNMNAPYLKKQFMKELGLSGEYDMFLILDHTERHVSDNETVVELYKHFEKGLFKITPTG